MQTTSDSPRPKRTAAKSRDTAQPTITVKKSRARKTPAAEAASPIPAAQSEVTSPSMTPPIEDIDRQIAMAAYFLAEERGFTPGHELDDWLEAERRIRSTASAGVRAGLS